MKRLIADFRRDERGATAIEYGFIAALISMAIIGAVSALGTEVGEMFDSIRGKFAEKTGG